LPEVVVGRDELIFALGDYWELAARLRNSMLHESWRPSLRATVSIMHAQTTMHSEMARC
jgi:hypothetical protein